jgi:hypothetical protein
MIPARDRGTWMSTAVPVAPRLELRPDAPARTILDGAWWPRSRTTVTELTDLLTALDARDLPVIRFMLDAGGWDEHPRRIGVAGRTVRLGWFTTLDACLLIGTSGTYQRVDLLVVPPCATEATARAAMAMATGAGNTLRPGAIMSAVSARAPRQRFGALDVGRAGESEIRRVNGHRSHRPS